VIAGRTRSRRQRAEVEVERRRTLCALVRCGHLAIAIPADLVIFIALADEVQVVDVGDRLRVSASGLVAAGWNLADLLEIEAEITTWMFLKAGSTTIALGCGACMTVEKLVDPDPLPRGLFRAGRDAIIGAFRVDDALLQAGCGLAGIWLDVPRLIGVDAIDAAAREEA
jgi:hypothetical protein